MKPRLILASLLCLSFCSNAQNMPQDSDLIGRGITLSVGAGHITIKDKYISSEWYDGKTSALTVSFSHSNPKSAYRVSFDYSGASDAKNHNVSASLMESSLSLDYSYLAGKFILAGKEVRAFAGPSPDLFLYYRKQQFASGGNALFDAYSFAFFMSMGLNAGLVMPLRKNVQIENFNKIALISLAGRLTDVNDKDATFFKKSDLLSGARGYSQFAIRYDVAKSLSLKTGYQFSICQSSSWDYLIAIADNLFFAITLRI